MGRNIMKIENSNLTEALFFANIVLADEINRTPPKTQSALLEAMQERQVTAAGQAHALELPFCIGYPKPY